MNEAYRKGALQDIENRLQQFSCERLVLADGGYTGKPFSEGVKQCIGARR